jgi:acyl carrier protein
MSNVTANDILNVITKADAVNNIEALINDKPLREQGIDSLDFSSVLFNIEEVYEIKIPDEDIDGLMTVNDIVQYVNNKLK